MTLRQLPNTLCVLRIGLVAPLVWLLVAGEYRLTLLLFAVAAVTDALDGWLAKRFGWFTELGKFLDPLADKLLLVTTFITLAVLDLAPIWLAVLVVGRDVVIGTGALIYRLMYGPLHGNPLRVSKLNTVCQILYVLAVVSDAALGDTGGGSGFPPQLLLVAGALVTLTTCVSGLAYVLEYSRRAAVAQRAAA